MRRRSRVRLETLTWLLMGVLAAPVWGQISPGKLARPHQKLEGMTNCTKCHTLGGGPDIKKCLECHGEIKKQLQEKSGYHYFLVVKRKRACFRCHSEHNGRDFRLIFWPNGQKKFDHRLTGFSLKGKHAQIECKECHRPEKMAFDLKKLNDKIDLGATFLGLDSNCLSCHADEHRGQLGRDCLRCHGFDGWKPAPRFSHDRARFRLTGRHREVPCGKCHPSVPLPLQHRRAGKTVFVKFANLEFRNCSACHEDVHRGKFGQTCTKCHDTSGWHRIRGKSFDHSMTRFPLLGMHKDVACEKCHTSGRFKKPLRFANCSDCHKDVHRGQFVDRADGGRCQSCHDVYGFVPAKFGIEEHVVSAYPLTGAHLAVPCVSCHLVATRGRLVGIRVFEFQNTRCDGCHADVHRGQFKAQIDRGGCESCHQTSDWHDNKFDHNQSRFPLLGKHRNVACEKCHKRVDVGTAKERILFKPMDRRCRGCHEDVHLGQFSRPPNPKACETCHTPEDWAALIFDHNRDALFKLRGAHEKVACGECHKEERKGSVRFIRFRPLDRRCEGCHGNK